MIELTCRHCGATFTKPNRKGPSPKYCSDDCRFTVRGKRVVTHGRGGYSAGCRCELCRAAQNERMREVYRRREAEGLRARGTSLVKQRTCEACGITFLTTEYLRRWCDDCRACECGGVRAKGCDVCDTCRKARAYKRVTVQLELKFPAPSPKLGPLRQALEGGDDDAVIAVLKSDTVQTDAGCWEWQRKISDGYPTARLGRRTVSVHRLMAEAIYGPLGSEPVHHRCANTTCIAPDHLQPITHRENVAEMLARTYLVRRIAELEAALTEVDPTHPALHPERIGAA